MDILGRRWQKDEEITYSNGIKSGPYISWNSDNYKVVEGEYLRMKNMEPGLFGMTMEL